MSPFLSKNMFVCVWCAVILAGINCNIQDNVPLKVNRFKRSEIDLQTCIDNFNIHRDKIIRTQDSQNMGAKYLNEIDLGSREECLRLCCETEDCDVFVFEEKNAGSCYLFHCGPPEDFKCKFTHHVNYSSAVLSINRRLPDLESQIKLTKHAQDISKLRKPEVDPDFLRLVPVVPEVDKPAPSSTSASVLTKEVIPIEKQTAEARKCSRYQFECRSTGECIAIYNACDGIPQCADGSDEAHELGCPAPEAVAGVITQTTATQPPRKVIQPPLQSIKPVQREGQQYGREGEIIQPPVKLPPANLQSLYHSQQQLPQVPPQNLPPDADFLRPVADPRNGGRTQYETVASAQAQNYMGINPFGIPNGWGMPRPAQGVGQQGVPQYQDKNIHGYNHKDTLQSEEQMNQIQYPETMNTRVSGYYGENYRQPVQQENWPIDDARYQVPQGYHPQENTAVLADKSLGSRVVYKAPESVQQNVEMTKPSETAVNPTHIQEKLAHDLKHSKDNMDHGSTSSNIKIKIKTETKPNEHHEQYPDVVAYKLTDDTQDGLSHIPRGAILSLTLGLIITSVMAILIGCRLRVVRRRLRKGGKGYAHDADYLVNGMYL